MEKTETKNPDSKPQGSSLAVRDHIICQQVKDKKTRIEIKKGKTKFSEIPAEYHATVIAEKLF